MGTCNDAKWTHVKTHVNHIVCKKPRMSATSYVLAWYLDVNKK